MMVLSQSYASNRAAIHEFGRVDGYLLSRNFHANLLIISHSQAGISMDVRRVAMLSESWGVVAVRMMDDLAQGGVQRQGVDGCLCGDACLGDGVKTSPAVPRWSMWRDARWLLGLTGVCLLLGASPLIASDGTINITGSVTAGTCVVSGSGTGSAKSIAVALPAVQTSALTASGEVAARTSFSISISDCGSGVTKATTYFEPGGTVNPTTGNLRLQGSSSATLVEIQLLNGSGSSSGGAAFSPIVLGATQAGQNSATYAVSSGAATLNYYAQYYATGAATAGTANSSVQFTMLYQ